MSWELNYFYQYLRKIKTVETDSIKWVPKRLKVKLEEKLLFRFAQSLQSVSSAITRRCSIRPIRAEHGPHMTERSRVWLRRAAHGFSSNVKMGTFVLSMWGRLLEKSKVRGHLSTQWAHGETSQQEGSMEWSVSSRQPSYFQVQAFESGKKMLKLWDLMLILS